MRSLKLILSSSAMMLALMCTSVGAHAATSTAPAQASGLMNVSGPGEDAYYVSTRSEHIIVHGHCDASMEQARRHTPLHHASLTTPAHQASSPIHR